MGPNIVVLFFVLVKVLTTDSDPYFGSHSEATTNKSSSELWSEKLFTQLETMSPFRGQSSPSILDSSVLLDEYEDHDQLSGSCYMENNLLYYFDRITEVYRLCILLAIVKDVIAIAHREKHPGFAYYCKIVSRSWFIKGLTKLLQAYIQHCSECLALQI